MAEQEGYNKLADTGWMRLELINKDTHMKLKAIVISLLLTSSLAHGTEIKVVKSGKNLLRDYPGSQLVTIYATAISYDAEGSRMAEVFTPPTGKDFTITQACTYKGGIRVSGVDVLYRPSDDGNTSCQTYTPGILAPQNQPVICFGYECTITGILR